MNDSPLGSRTYRGHTISWYRTGWYSVWLTDRFYKADTLDGAKNWVDKHLAGEL